MNGLDLASRIRQMSPGLPIILATGFADFQSPAAIEFPRLGKPYSQDELAKTLEAALEPQASPR
jgi:DNA-binding LytR/AlgR family response regulator